MDLGGNNMAIDLTDKTSNGNDLTNSGAAEYTADTPFAASTITADLELTESDYLYAVDSASLSITGDLSLECWVKFEALPAASGFACFVSKYEDNTGVDDSRSYFFGLYNNAGVGNLRFIYSTDGTYQGVNDRNVTWTPDLATWYHVAVTFTAATPVLKFYVNGVQQGTDQSPTNTSIHDNASNLAIGAGNTKNTARYFLDGIVDDVRVWNDVRTITEIDDNKSIELVGNEAGLVAYWPFESLPVVGAFPGYRNLLGVGQ